MNRIVATRTRAYALIMLMAVAGATCRVPESKETLLANASTATTAQNVAAESSSIILQSKDGGETWQDVSAGLPVLEQPEGFFAGPSDIYVHVKTGMYRSRSDLKTPVWEKTDVPNLVSRSDWSWASTSITFNHSGAVAYNDDGQLYQNTSAAGTWSPMYTDFKQPSLRAMFESSDGTLFLGYDYGLYKSSDKGKNWKLVQSGPAYNIIESGGVLMANRGTGIMRSTDNGDTWKGVISDGRVGHFVESIKGGFIVVSEGKLNQLRKIRISQDGGETWQFIDAGLPPSRSIPSLKQLGKYLICAHPDGIFRSADMGKTWTLVHATREESKEAGIFVKASYNTQPDNASKKVFTIYTSGNTLYAVAKVLGC